ncbi:MAG: glycosyltransferase [Ktedonobacteraceae bacterium]
MPAWNATDTLKQCLIAIEQSTFNCKYQQQLEVVVVDDGSTDGTWELLEQLRLNVRLKAVRQAHHSRAHTQNTGIAAAEGDVIICCDADMILTPFSIEEIMRRHQVLDGVILIGFRGDVQRDDPRIQPDVLHDHLPRFLPPFERDVRLNYGVGWPESMCRDTDHLKRLGEGNYLIMPDGIRWTLANMVYGAFFSIARKDFEEIDGYDERFYGWGCEDTLVGVRALASGEYIIPVYSAAGLHIAHDDRSPRKWQEFAANRRVLQSILRTPFTPGNRQWLPGASRRISEHFAREPVETIEMSTCALDVFTEALADATQRGKYLYTLGDFDGAVAAFAQAQGTPEQEAWALFEQGKALRAGGKAGQAIPLLVEAAARLPLSLWPPLFLALALAEQGDFASARVRIEQARDLDPSNGWVRFLYQGRHINRAEAHAQQGEYVLAARDYEAALMLNPHDVRTRIEYATALASAGRRDNANRTLVTCTGTTGRNNRQFSIACVKLAEEHMSHNEIGSAKRALEEARRRYPQDQEVIKRMDTIHLAAAQAHPIPFAREIAKRVQTIPGWFSEEETELLIALAIGSITCSNPNVPPVLVEIGSYCGRATVAMGLTVHSLGRGDVRIVSVDEPDIGPAPGGGHPRDILRPRIAEYGLSEVIIYAPEDDTESWLHPSRLVLVDGRHYYSGICDDVEKYSPQIAQGGYLLFHDYADYFPDVQRYVDEMLADEHCPFQFVAHVGTLIAFVKRAEIITKHDSEQDSADRAPPTAPIWMYWEGPMPAYIALCCKTIFAHNRHVRLLNRASFDDLFIRDRDIDIDQLALNHQSDFVRAYLLKHYGGLYVDVDCIVMHNLAPLLELAKQIGFVGYREPQGNISAGLMVSVANGEVITEHYQSVCNRIRRGGTFEWLDLGSWPLERALAKYPQNHHLVPTETIMPIHWYRSEELCVQRSDNEHEYYLQRDAFCYMLSNATISGREQTKVLTTLSEEELLKGDYFISFLFRKALDSF